MSRLAFLSILALAGGCGGTGGARPVATVTIAPAPPAAVPWLPRGLAAIPTGLPALRLACDPERAVWANVNGEITLYRFGAAAPEALPALGELDVDGLALAGGSVYALGSHHPPLGAGVPIVVEGTLRALEGGRWRTVASGFFYPSALAADAERIVWIAATTPELYRSLALHVLEDGRVTTIPLDAGKLCASGGFCPRHLVLDGTAALVEGDQGNDRIDLVARREAELPGAPGVVPIAARGGRVLALENFEPWPGGRDARLVLWNPAGGERRVLIAALGMESDRPVADVTLSDELGCATGLDSQPQQTGPDDGKRARVRCVALDGSRPKLVAAAASTPTSFELCGPRRLVWARDTGRAKRGWELGILDVPE